jgi:hypothetical protein
MNYSLGVLSGVSPFYFIDLFFYMSMQEKEEEGIRISNFRFIRRGSQPIELPVFFLLTFFFDMSTQDGGEKFKLVTFALLGMIFID